MTKQTTISRMFPAYNGRIEKEEFLPALALNAADTLDALGMALEHDAIEDDVAARICLRLADQLHEAIELEYGDDEGEETCGDVELVAEGKPRANALPQCGLDHTLQVDARGIPGAPLPFTSERCALLSAEQFRAAMAFLASQAEAETANDEEEPEVEEVPESGERGEDESPNGEVV